VVSVSSAFIDRSELAQLSRPHPNTIRQSADSIWRVCVELRQQVSAYTAAMIHLHRCLVFNPALLAKIEDPQGHNLMIIVAGCIITAFLTEGQPKKIEDVCRILNVNPQDVLAVQRTVLETSCFDFRHTSVPLMTIRIGKTLNTLGHNQKKTQNGSGFARQYGHASKISLETAKLAFQIAIDAYETTAVLQFPAHEIAAACIEIAHRQATGEMFRWDLAQFALNEVSMDASIRLLLDFYTRCVSQSLPTHAPTSALAGPELQEWLSILRQNAHTLKTVDAPPVRDADVSSQGVARYLIDA